MRRSSQRNKATWSETSGQMMRRAVITLYSHCISAVRFCIQGHCRCKQCEFLFHFFLYFFSLFKETEEVIAMTRWMAKPRRTL